MKKITEDIYYAGVNDHQVDLFEGQFAVPNGMAYNSYVIMDEKIAVMDTVDVNFGEEWLANVAEILWRQKAGLSGSSAYGTGSFCEYHKIYRSISRG